MKWIGKNIVDVPSLFREDVRLDKKVVDSTGSAGTAGQQLLSTATATVWTDPDLAGGWFGSTTLLKVMPTDFFMNDDYNRAPVMVEDDVANKLGIIAPSTLTELYAFIAIPTGYKADKVQVYASASTVSAVLVKKFIQTTGATQDLESGDFNSLIDITDITSSTTMNLVLKLSPASITTVIYGADIAIKAV